MIDRNVLLSSLAVALTAALVARADGEVVRDIRYSDAAPCCTGDLYLPKGWTAETPVVVTIHGGAWNSLDRSGYVAAAELCVRDFKYAAFNIDYRLVPNGKDLSANRAPWPACGRDCVDAAKYVLGAEFAAKYGLKPRRVWLMGSSAGGHLALWAGLTLPAEQVAGIVSISGIADTNVEIWQRFSQGWQGVNPVDLIRRGGPKVLLTHARGDRVVTVESARKFAAAYRAAGNDVMYVEYPFDIEPNLTGHCTWRTGPGPRRFIQTLERRIAYFMLPPRVPAPEPVKSAVEITALYYPGTEHMAEWDMMAQTRPETKPLLGWYDEGDPEVIDWQVKWSVEHGISSYCVDWYWNKGYRRLTHWVTGFYQAKHRKYLKWYMMYANHNQPGAHSTADQIAVTKYWIDNYFKTPEYYTIDGKPVVCYWSPENLDRDFIAEAAAKGEKLASGEGVKRAFAISERMAREAGLPGIHWQVMWYGTAYDPVVALFRRDEGFSSSMCYGYLGEVRPLAPELAKDDPRRTFEMVQKGMPRLWQSKAVQQELPWWLPLPAGWDDRPRSFQRANVIWGRTPEKFAEICRAARAFCEKYGLRHAVIQPLNEWQEGSYIEPNEEFGFGMYDAIRDAFCEKPAAGWPKNLKPSDVGLGPYDFPASYRSPVPAWTFDGGSMEGWYRQPYGGGELEVKDGELHFWVTRVNNYNIRQMVKPFDASKYRAFRIRLRVTPNAEDKPAKIPPQKLRLKWGTAEMPIVKPGIVVDDKRCVASCPVRCDGAFREYALDLSANPDWKGAVDELWLEASQLMHARVAIDWMRFE